MLAVTWKKNNQHTKKECFKRNVEKKNDQQIEMEKETKIETDLA